MSRSIRAASKSFEHLEGVGSVGGGGHLVAVVGERHLDELADALVVVHDEDPLRRAHRRRLAPSAHRQRGHHLRPAALGKVGLEATAVEVHDLAADVEAEAHPSEAVLGVGLVEAVEDPRAVLGRDAEAVVPDSDPDVAALFRHVHLDRPAARAVADGVLHQVRDDLLQAERVHQGQSGPRAGHASTGGAWSWRRPRARRPPRGRRRRSPCGSITRRPASRRETSRSWPTSTPSFSGLLVDGRAGPGVAARRRAPLPSRSGAGGAARSP